MNLKYSFVYDNVSTRTHIMLLLLTAVLMFFVCILLIEHIYFTWGWSLGYSELTAKLLVVMFHLYSDCVHFLASAADVTRRSYYAICNTDISIDLCTYTLRYMPLKKSYIMYLYKIYITMRCFRTDEHSNNWECVGVSYFASTSRDVNKNVVADKKTRTLTNSKIWR